jgi:hypothetical protein
MTVRETILSTTRFGALATAPGWGSDGFACASARDSNATFTASKSSRISTTFCAFPYEVMWKAPSLTK